MVGTLSATSAIGTTTYPALAGAGTFSGTTKAVIPDTASLNGAGALSAARIPQYQSAAALSGVGALAAPYSQKCPIPQTLTGTGVLTAPSFEQYNQASGLAGGGVLSSTVVIAGSHYTDNFNRANAATLGSPWVNKYRGSGSADLSITSNAMSVGGNSIMYVDGYGSAMFTDNHKVTIQTLSTMGAQSLILVVRGNSTDGYVCYLYVSGSVFYIYTNANWSTMWNNLTANPSGTQRASGTTTSSIAANDIISLQAQGNTYTAAQNATTICSWVDAGGVMPTGSTQRTTGVGVMGVANTAYFDNFTADDI